MKQLAPKLYSWASIYDFQTELQAKQLSELPIVQPYLAQMPDCHFGKGAPVGTVLPTVGAIIPAAVGVDIGCGMIALRTQFFQQDVNAFAYREKPLSDLYDAIVKAIPSSMGRYNTHIRFTAREKIEDLEGMPGAQQAYDATRVWHEQLGSLGSGNHFIEVTVDEEDRIWLFLHSGSRGVGNRLAMRYIKAALEQRRAAGTKLVNPDHAWLDEGTPEFGAYMEALAWAQHFAFLNREEMMDRLVDVFETWIGDIVRASETVNCHHNYTERLESFGGAGKVTYLSRKGAINAERGRMGLIPGSMGAASYVVEGLGNPQSFWSAPHGAGRLHSRGSAKRTFTLEEVQAQMEGIEWGNDKALLDEAPGAYKPVTQVIEDSRDLVTVKHELHPIVNVKGL